MTEELVGLALANAYACVFNGNALYVSVRTAYENGILGGGGKAVYGYVNCCNRSQAL